MSLFTPSSERRKLTTPSSLFFGGLPPLRTPLRPAFLPFLAPPLPRARLCFLDVEVFLPPHVERERLRALRLLDEERLVEVDLRRRRPDPVDVPALSSCGGLVAADDSAGSVAPSAGVWLPSCGAVATGGWPSSTDGEGTAVAVAVVGLRARDKERAGAFRAGLAAAGFLDAERPVRPAAMGDRERTRERPRVTVVPAAGVDDPRRIEAVLDLAVAARARLFGDGEHRRRAFVPAAGTFDAADVAGRLAEADLERAFAFAAVELERAAGARFFGDGERERRAFVPAAGAFAAVDERLAAADLERAAGALAGARERD